MKNWDKILPVIETLGPEDIEQAFQAVEVFEQAEMMCAAEAEEWRRQIRERAAKFVPGPDRPQ